jgi:cobalt-zinc-cadmium efflux system membrane fusion protein
MSNASHEGARVAGAQELGAGSASGLSKGKLFGQLVAAAVILGIGGIAATYMLSIERVVSKASHGHDEGGKDDGHGHGGGAHEGHSDEKKIVKLTPKQIRNAGLTIEPAAEAKIRESVVLNGIIQPNEEQVVAVLPRFGGIVRSVTRRLGEKVAKGNVVGRIESNESLTQYDLTAPMSGTVIERKGALGEYADKDKRIMVIADLSTVWVDFRVYQQDFSKLSVGQAVEIALNGTRKSSTISYISPIGMTDTQSMLARAVVDNKDGSFRPGLYVTGRVLLAEQEAPVAIKQSAIQYIDGKPIVFVETEHGFEAREVEFGARDHELIEVIFGVVAGDKVVVGNSFAMKAELGKGQATHEH